MTIAKMVQNSLAPEKVSIRFISSRACIKIHLSATSLMDAYVVLRKYNIAVFTQEVVVTS